MDSLNAQIISGTQKEEYRMANEELVRLLKQGSEPWNAWRMKSPDAQPLDLGECDLSGLDLHGINLSGANLSSARLHQTNLSHANLTDADLVYADLSQADLSQTNLSRAIIMYARFDGANLSHADLSHASLVETDFMGTNLYRTNMSQADLNGSVLAEALFIETDVSGVDFTSSTMYRTVLCGVDLRSTGGLQSILHLGPSHLSLSTIARSHGTLPKKFLQGMGTPEGFIQSLSSIFPLPDENHSSYISYSPWDKAFAERLHADLQDLGIRCWLSPKYTSKQGKWLRHPLYAQIEASMDPEDKVVLVLSRNSLKSPWIETIINNALRREVQIKRPILFLCQLDNAILETQRARKIGLLTTHRIFDFTQWEIKEAYKNKLTDLLTELKMN